MPAPTLTPSRGRTGSAWRGLLLLALTGVVWGTIGTAVWLVHSRSGMSPLTISAYRAVAGFLALALAALVMGRLPGSWAFARAQWRRVVAVGVLTAVFQMLFFVAVVAAGVSVTTVVSLGFAPVLLLVVDAVRRRRSPGRGQAATVVAAVAGLALVGTAGGASSAPHPVLGVLAALASGAAYALSAELGAPLSRRHDTLTVTTATMSVAALLLVPCGLVPAYVGGGTLTTGDVSSWGLVVYLGVVTMAIAYALLFAGLRTTPGGAAVVATLLEPVTAVVLAAVVLDESLTVLGIVGSLLIVAAIASLGRRPAPQ